VPTPTVAPFATVDFRVLAGRFHRVLVDVKYRSGNIEYEFSSNLSIDFKAFDPEGNGIAFLDQASTGRGTVNINSPGEYALVSDNGFSLLASKDVTFKARVVPPWGR
jgi:hypothetical protein